MQQYLLTRFPKELNKKVTLLQHFRSYLEVKQGEEVDSKDLSKKLNEHQVYVKKWMRTKHAIMFRLSNKIV